VGQRHLRYFVAVAEEGHIGRAAERLHIAQPPLSRQIQQLEAELGVELFTRTRRGVEMTEAARTFLPLARTALLDADRAVTLAQRVNGTTVPSLRIGFGWSAGFEVLHALGQALHEHHPDLSLLTEEMWNAKLCNALVAGEIDVAIALNPDLLPSLAYETIRQEPLVALVPDNHPLAGQSDVPLSAFAGKRLLLMPRALGPRLFDSVIDICRRAGFEPLAVERSFRAASNLGLRPVDCGFALCPLSTAMSAPDGLCVVSLSQPAPSLPTMLLWHRESNSPGLQAVLDVAHALGATRGQLGSAA
jgi:DNA-binding transcriptional LysR family regulator